MTCERTTHGFYHSPEAVQLGKALTARGWRCATAESCTAGLTGTLITSVPGASAWYAGGVIAYANEVKQHLLGVPSDALERFGAVSEPVARAMASGAAKQTGVEAAVSLTGIAGPDGGSPEKPVGTVWIGIHVNGRAQAHVYCFKGSRDEIRRQAAETALGLLTKAVES